MSWVVITHRENDKIDPYPQHVHSVVSSFGNFGKRCKERHEMAIQTFTLRYNKQCEYVVTSFRVSYNTLSECIAMFKSAISHFCCHLPAFQKAISFQYLLTSPYFFNIFTVPNKIINLEGSAFL